MMENIILNKIRMCSRCILDSTIPGISFDKNGMCNYCLTYDKLAKKEVLTGERGRIELQLVIDKIKKDGRNKKYDCIIGLSGGVDSSYVAWLVKKNGLRALAVHLDNGWNSEIAVKNIHNIVNKLGFELYTHVIDWEEFKDLQIAFLKAGVVDIELLTDHAITAIMYKLAKREKIHYFLSGYNIVTEAIMPVDWVYSKWDKKNIISIHKEFGTRKIPTYPTYGFITKIMGEIKYKTVNILNYVEYRREDAIRILHKELNWEYYGGKHYESIFTKFYQTYILIKKFNIDKRKAHLSNMICSGQISREDAIKELKKPFYKDAHEENKEIEYIIKKLGIDRLTFDKIINQKPKSHTDYPNGQYVNRKFKIAKNYIQKLSL